MDPPMPLLVVVEFIQDRTGDGGWVLAARAGCWLTLAVER